MNLKLLWTSMVGVQRKYIFFVLIVIWYALPLNFVSNENEQWFFVYIQIHRIFVYISYLRMHASHSVICSVSIKCPLQHDWLFTYSQLKMLSIDVCSMKLINNPLQCRFYGLNLLSFSMLCSAILNQFAYIVCNGSTRQKKTTHTRIEGKSDYTS